MIAISKFKYSIYLVLGLLLLNSFSFASEIKGIVTDKLDKTVLGETLIVIEDPKDDNLKIQTMSDKDGSFYFDDIAPGVYKIAALREGYYSNCLFDFKVKEGKKYSVSISLIQHKKDWNGEFCFMIGGVEVLTDEKVLISETPMTIRQIHSGEIEHMQASSLGDVLSLVPGVEKTANPGLSSVSKVGLRSTTLLGTDGIIESFGTTVIVDGIEITNDANADGTGVGGIDLRIIPADNINSVKVITGIPSVEYGNFSNGVIEVETKSGVIQKKVKAKLNPDTKTFSLSDGYQFFGNRFNYHLNYGYSERNLRLEGDEYHRIHLGATIKRETKQKTKIKVAGTLTKIYDSDEPVGPYQTVDYDRGYRSTASLKLNFDKNPKNTYLASINLNLNDIRLHKEKWVSEQKFITFDTSYTDTNALGDIVTVDTSLTQVLPGYIGSYDKFGKEWIISSKFQNRRKKRIGRTHHKFLSGFEYKLKMNTGDGFVVDPEWSYYGQYSTQRSYSYDDYKPSHEYSFYGEDEMHLKLLNRKLTTVFGFRYDLFNINGLDFALGEADFDGIIKTEHGGFFCPRFNVKYDISDNFHLRFGGGTSSKAVSLSYINKSPAYYEYMVDTLRVVETVLQINPYLTAYTTDKIELSLDYKINDYIGMTLTGYQNESSNMPASISYPWGYYDNPDTLSTATYSLYENVGWSKSRGLEFSLRTKRYKSMSYQLNVTYRQSERGRNRTIYDSRPDTTWEDIWYEPKTTEREKILIDQRFTFVNQRLGVWVTLDIQNIVLDHYQYTYNSNSKTVEIDDEERIWYQGMSQYWWETQWISYDARWRADFRITKSLSSNSEVSLYINNFLDNRGESIHDYLGTISYMNPSIFYGLELSTQW